MSVSDDIMLSLHFQDQTSLSTGLEPFKNSIFDLIKTDKIVSVEVYVDNKSL